MVKVFDNILKYICVIATELFCIDIFDIEKNDRVSSYVVFVLCTSFC